MNGQTLLVARAAVAVDVHHLLDVGGNGSAEVTFHMIVGFNLFTESSDLILGQILGTGIGIDARLCQNFFGTGQTDSVDLSEGNLNALVIGDIYTC